MLLKYIVLTHLRMKDLFTKYNLNLLSQRANKWYYDIVLSIKSVDFRYLDLYYIMCI